MKLPPKMVSLSEEDRKTFLKLINSVELMKLLQEISPLKIPLPRSKMVAVIHHETTNNTLSRAG